MKLDKHLFRQQAFIDGEWVGSGSIPVTNPSNFETIGKVTEVGAAGAERAIDAADKAWHGWKNTAGVERSRLLGLWAARMHELKQPLAEIMTAEQGKPLAESLGEIDYAASFIQWFAEEARRISGRVMSEAIVGKKIITLRQSVGVTAVITPWNFPSAMITRKVAPALAAGCTTVIRPASETPFSALALAVIAEEVGIPPGVVNVITGKSDPIGRAMTDSDKVRKLSFTGSTGVGRLLMGRAAATIKNLSLELGGNAPFIVLADADLGIAVEAAIASKFRNAGQTCVCADRFFVQQPLYRDFCRLLAEKTSELKIGDGFAPGVEVGPMISASALEATVATVAAAVAAGAKILCGGEVVEKGKLFFAPTVLADVTPQMAVMAEENFAPIAPVMSFKTVDEAIKLANNSPFGLASYLCGKDLANVLKVAEEIEAGIVGINTGIISNAAAPFGGVKQSGIGREGGAEGLDAFLETKYICLANG